MTAQELCLEPRMRIDGFRVPIACREPGYWAMWFSCTAFHHAFPMRTTPALSGWIRSLPKFP